jgi:hypothetical protein
MSGIRRGARSNVGRLAGPGQPRDILGALTNEADWPWGQVCARLAVRSGYTRVVRVFKQELRAEAALQ